MRLHTPPPSTVALHSHFYKCYRAQLHAHIRSSWRSRRLETPSRGSRTRLGRRFTWTLPLAIQAAARQRTHSRQLALRALLLDTRRERILNAGCGERCRIIVLPFSVPILALFSASTLVNIDETVAKLGQTHQTCCFTVQFAKRKIEVQSAKTIMTML